MDQIDPDEDGDRHPEETNRREAYILQELSEDEMEELQQELQELREEIEDLKEELKELRE